MNALNQSFFMGSFVFLSGWFSRSAICRSLQRRESSHFMKVRIYRLLIPAVFFTLFIDPLMDVLMVAFGPNGAAWHRTMPRFLILSGSIFWDSWVKLAGIKGPVWYTVLLAIFDTVALFLTHLTETSYLMITQRSASTILKLWMAVIILSFTVRQAWPVGAVFGPLNLQPAFLPQYIFAYGLGQASETVHDPCAFLLFHVQKRPASRLICALALSTISLGVIVYIPAAFASVEMPPLDIDSITGGLTFTALLYAVWNEASFAMILPCLLSTFSKYFNDPWVVNERRGRPLNLARYLYAAFLLHPPVSLIVELYLDHLMGCHGVNPSRIPASFGPLLWTLLTGCVNVVASWFAAVLLVEYVPLVGRII
ncbi:hypothetical protein ABEF91_003128 [Exophiala dermatitidis]